MVKVKTIDWMLTDYKNNYGDVANQAVNADEVKKVLKYNMDEKPLILFIGESASGIEDWIINQWFFDNEEDRENEFNRLKEKYKKL